MKEWQKNHEDKMRGRSETRLSSENTVLIILKESHIKSRPSGKYDEVDDSGRGE